MELSVDGMTFNGTVDEIFYIAENLHTGLACRDHIIGYIPSLEIGLTCGELDAMN